MFKTLFLKIVYRKLVVKTTESLNKIVDIKFIRSYCLYKQVFRREYDELTKIGSCY